MAIKTSSARQKGASFERWVAEKLSVALNCNARRSGVGFDGSDIVGLPEWLSVEAKRREAWSWDYVNQTLKDAKDKTGILFWKRNNREALAIMRAEDLFELLTNQKEQV